MRFWRERRDVMASKEAVILESALRTPADVCQAMRSLKRPDENPKCHARFVN